jgi:dTDP-4-dehydrorhamnose 3,5-epimerase
MIHRDTIHVEPTNFHEARLLLPIVYDDHRGTFQETYSEKKYEALGLKDVFVQDSLSVSARNVLRGLHGDTNMSKLVTCVRGRIWDCIVDFRPSSPTYLHWQGFYLTDANHHQLYVPHGFGHGFFALTDVIVAYKQSAHHNPASEFCIRWNDPAIGIRWPGNPRYPIISDKDANAPLIIRPEREIAA